MASDLIKLGGLWTNKDKNGKTYLTGKLSPSVRILIFKNEFRETENQPTHILYLSQVEQQPGEENKPEEQDDFFSEEVAPAAAATARPLAPRSAAPAPRTPAAAPSRTPAPPPARPAPQRRPAPPEEELDDPFAE